MQSEIVVKSKASGISNFKPSIKMNNFERNSIGVNNASKLA